MISGALLMKKEESYKVILTKRVFRYIIVLLVFSFVQYIFLGGDPNSNTYSGWKDKSLVSISHNGLISYFVTFFMSIWSKPIIAAFFVCNVFMFPLEYRVFGLQYFRPDNFIIVYVILLFVIFKKFNNCFEKKKIILYISSATFGIYLTEFILHAIHYDLYIWYAKYLPYMLAVCIRNSITILIGTLVFVIIKRIRFVSKFI